MASAVRADVVLGKGRVGVSGFQWRGLRFAFLRVFKDAEVGQQRAVEKPKSAVVFEPGGVAMLRPACT